MVPIKIPPKNVYFVGPGSTGKTTLAEALHEKVSSVLLSEVARTVLRQLKYTADDISNNATNYNLQKCILLEQYHQERKLLKMHQMFFSDRCAVDPIVYAKFYMKNERIDLLDMVEWQEMKLKYQNDQSSLIVLIEPNEIFLKDDGIRKMPTDLEEWHLFYRTYVTFMIENSIPFKVIPRSMTDIFDRMNQVVEWMKN